MSEKKVVFGGKKTAYIVLFAIFAIAVLAVEVFGIKFVSDPILNDLIYGTVARLFGAGVCIIMLSYCSLLHIISPVRKVSIKRLLLIIPCWLVVINNFPFIPFVSGNATLDAIWSYVLLYAVQCLCVGIFEECAFRGCVFMLILEGNHKTKKDVFFSIIYSSLIFGGIHIVNLFAGSGIVPVIQQLGYSFLIGAMCAVALILTKNLWTSILLHACFNFAGGLIPTLGKGEIWDTPTIVITAVLAVIVTVYMVIVFINLDTSDIGDMFKKTKKGSRA